MRWFKHLTRAHLDQSITPVLASMGPEGYGLYWLVCEIVAESMDKSDRCELTHPEAEWARQLYVARPRVTRVMSMLQKNGLLTFSETTEDGCKYVTVKIRTLLKYRDEYSSRPRQTPNSVPTVSGQTPDSVPTKDTEAEADTETDAFRLAAAVSPSLDDVSDTAGNPNASGKTVRKRTAGVPVCDHVARLDVRLRERHPAAHSATPKRVIEKLNAAFNETPKSRWDELERHIDEAHTFKCSSVDWQKEDGRFSRGLLNWITGREWTLVKVQLPKAVAAPLLAAQPPAEPKGTPMTEDEANEVIAMLNRELMERAGGRAN